MAGYTRQSTADIVPGAEVTAAPLNAEFNQIQAAMHGSTGHNHAGGSGNGPQLSLTAAVTGILPVANGGVGAALTTTVDNTVPRFNGTAGIMQTSGVVISDTDVITSAGLTSSGAISGTTGTFSSTVSMTGLTATTGTFSGAVSMAGLTATTGTFSGAVSMAGLTATTGSFSSTVATGALTVTGIAAATTFSGSGASLTNLPTTQLVAGAIPATATVNNGNWSGTDLSVANGGTGASTLTGIVIGNGTSAFTTVTAPAGAVVGTTDTQTLTNKSIVATQLTGTVASARISGSYTGVTGVGALNAGSITSGFGNIDIGSSTFTTTGAVSIGALSGTTATFSGQVIADGSGQNLVVKANNATTGPAYVRYQTGDGTNIGYIGMGSTSTILSIARNTTGTIDIDATSTGSILISSANIDLDISGNFEVAGTSLFDSFIGSSDTTAVFHTTGAGTVFLRPNGSASATGEIRILSSGHTTINGDVVATGTITASSDARLKNDIETVENGLDKINSLRGVSFTKNGKKSLGVIAQEVREILPELVLEDEDGYLSVAYGNIVGVLIEAVKELTERVKVLEAK